MRWAGAALGLALLAAAAAADLNAGPAVAPFPGEGHGGLPPAARSPAVAAPRPDAETIRQATRDILADPRFSPRKTFLQWLLEKLSWDWTGPAGNWPAADPRWFWPVIVLCMAILAAILGHFGWWVAVQWRSRRRAARAAGLDAEFAHFRRAEDLPEEDLAALARRLAAARRFREALGALALALLRRLDVAGILRFQTGKTNGEYLREFPRAAPGREPFGRFVAAFDRTVYGGAACGPDTYARLNALREEIAAHVHAEP